MEKIQFQKKFSLLTWPSEKHTAKFKIIFFLNIKFPFIYSSRECFRNIMPMAVLVCNQIYLFMCVKGLKLKPKTPQISKKNVWKLSSVAVLAKFNKWTLRTKLCSPPQGKYLLIFNFFFFWKFQNHITEKNSLS